MSLIQRTWSIQTHMKRLKSTKRSRDRLKKTSIDFTLCDKQDRPILCIEFDGMQDGFNIGSSYYAKAEASPWRKQITELKLKVAHGSSFPYFVLGSDYFKDIGENTRLRIVDGIIGEVLANRAARNRFSQGFNPEEVGYSQDDFEALTKSEQHEIIQDWVMGVEVISDIKHNPIYQITGELALKAGTSGFSMEFLYSADLDNSITDEERIRRISSQPLQGVKITITSKRGKNISASVWIPNLKIPYFAGITLAQEIAHLIALEKAIEDEKD